MEQTVEACENRSQGLKRGELEQAELDLEELDRAGFTVKSKCPRTTPETENSTAAAEGLDSLGTFQGMRE